ncbi:MAG: hypothetical protein COZ56_10550 [Armatimonadetes bacterium CG_4_8_14_3_um_filter_58_9]|nr:MAG: hypothetical protein COZ56_10550 [Armatimonadetes bacterium CG_4_8_14_3_um_filter_58_9]PJB63169.1 MAG: hypothetical protein CO095_17080 [Armatimonadetes bacterium CG_4_9_14_3_um_filter_58_7]
MSRCPPGYRQAAKFLTEAEFTDARCSYGEQIHNEALPRIPRKGASIWLSSPHAFHGISQVNSRVNYIIHRNSPLAQRTRLSQRFLRYRDLEKRLRTLAGCKPLRQGRGSHELWVAPNGHSFPVPRHSRELGTDLVAKLIKQAGLKLSVSQFLNENV